MKSCIFCSATDNLTTSMNVKTTRGETEVHICGEHEDDASPKKVRQLVEGRESALAEMEEKLKAMGLAIVPISQATGGIVVAHTPQAPSQPVPAAEVLSEMKPTAAAPKAPAKMREIDAPAVAVDKGGRQVNLGKERSYDTTKAVTTRDGTVHKPPTIVESEIQTVEVRGVPMRLPKKVVDSDGSKLEIKVLPTAGSTQAMEQRFKDMANRTMGNDGSTPDFRHEYDVKDPRPCNFCGGSGKAKIGDQACPRCKGAGELI